MKQKNPLNINSNFVFCTFETIVDIVSGQAIVNSIVQSKYLENNKFSLFPWNNINYTVSLGLILLPSNAVYLPAIWPCTCLVSGYVPAWYLAMYLPGIWTCTCPVSGCVPTWYMAFYLTGIWLCTWIFSGIVIPALVSCWISSRKAWLLITSFAIQGKRITKVVFKRHAFLLNPCWVLVYYLTVYLNIFRLCTCMVSCYALDYYLTVYLSHVYLCTWPCTCSLSGCLTTCYLAIG